MHEIRESVTVLKDKLRQAVLSLNRLRKTKATLEHDIDIKERSLEIDYKKCMGARKNMAMDHRSGPIFNIPLMAY